LITRNNFTYYTTDKSIKDNYIYITNNIYIYIYSKKKKKKKKIENNRKQCLWNSRLIKLKFNFKELIMKLREQ